MIINGYKYNGREFDDTIEDLQFFVDNGYKFYVTNDTEGSGTDPWSGMPNNHLEYWAFKDRSDAEEFANVATGNIYNPSAKSSVNNLEDLLNDRKLLAKNIADKVAKDKAAADKRKEYNKNLPEWRKVRTQAIKAKNAYNQIKSQLDQLKLEYDTKLDQLKQSLDAAGIEYSDIESVLSKDFLKN